MTTEALTIKGGGSKKVIKTHLKRDDATVALARRAMTHIEKGFFPDLDESPFADQPVPEMLLPFMNWAMTDVERIKDGEPDIIKRALKQVPGDVLVTLKEMIMQTRGGHTEDRLVRLLRLTYPLIDVFDIAKFHVEKAQKTAIKTCVEVFAEEYSKYRDGESIFSNEAFRIDIQSEIDQRAGASSAGAPVAEPGHRCSVQ